MEILGDSCMALFASIGIWTMVSLLIGWFFPDECLKNVYSIVCLKGSSFDVERLLSKILKKSSDAVVFLVDCGLNAEGREYVSDVLKKRTGVIFTSVEDLDEKVKEAVEWTRQNS